MNTISNRSLQLLKDGNRRFIASCQLHPNQTAQRRQEVCAEQKPFAAVVGCSDSRVPPEIVFDAGLGDIFVVRLAGTVIDDMAIGSLEYAVEHLHVPLIVVLGHSSCGAVSAALSGKKHGGHIDAVCEAIRPAIKKAKTDSVDEVVKVNVRMAVERLKKTGPVLDEAVKKGDVKIVAAYYDLKSGVAEFLSKILYRHRHSILRSE
jgi:carbonic anhydrase